MPPMPMIASIPVSQLEFDGHTIWVHSPLGGTVLRIKVNGGIDTVKCADNPVSHMDLQVPGAAVFCLAGDIE